MKPIARTDRLIKQVVDQETLIYDSADDTACCLNAVASSVWRRCDGQHTVSQIAEVLASEIPLPEGTDATALTFHVLDELEAHRLIVAPAEPPTAKRVDRREAVRALALLPFLPTVQQITAPMSMTAASPVATGSVTPSASSTPTLSPTATPTLSMTRTPTATPTLSMTRTPTATPTPSVSPSVAIP